MGRMNREDAYKILLLKWIATERRKYSFPKEKELIKKGLNEYKKTNRIISDEEIQQDYNVFFENFDNDIYRKMYKIKPFEDGKIRCNYAGNFFVCYNNNGICIHIPFLFYVRYIKKGEKYRGFSRTHKNLKDAIDEFEITDNNINKFVIEKRDFLCEITRNREANPQKRMERKNNHARRMFYRKLIWLLAIFALIILAIFNFSVNLQNLSLYKNMPICISSLLAAFLLIWDIKLETQNDIDEIFLAKEEIINEKFKRIEKRCIYCNPKLSKKEYSTLNLREIDSDKGKNKWNVIMLLKRVCRLRFVFAFLFIVCFLIAFIRSIQIACGQTEVQGIGSTTETANIQEMTEQEEGNDLWREENSDFNNRPELMTYFTAAQAHVRETHSVSSKSIDILQRDIEVEILDIYDEEERNLWYQIKYKEGKTGWVNRKVLRPEIQNSVPITSVMTTSGIDVSDLYDGYIETNWKISEDMIDHYSRVYVKLEKVSDVFGLILYNGNYCARDFDSYGTVSQIEVWTQEEGGYDYKVDTEYNVDGAEILFKEALHTDEIIIIVKEIEPGDNTGSSTINTACIGDLVVLGE